MMALAINLVNDFQPQGLDRGLKIEIDQDSFHKAFGKKLLLIEKNLVAQAMSNILENAVKYAESETNIRVSALADNNIVSIMIDSKGIPITDAEKANIFARGFRGAAARQKVAAGTGIGLYLASRVMQFPAQRRVRRSSAGGCLRYFARSGTLSLFAAHDVSLALSRRRSA